MRPSKFMFGLIALFFLLLLGGLALKSLQEKEKVSSCQQESSPAKESNSNEESVPTGDDNSTEEKKLEETLYTNNAAMPTGTEVSWKEKIALGCFCVLGLWIVYLIAKVGFIPPVLFLAQICRQHSAF